MESMALIALDELIHASDSTPRLETLLRNPENDDQAGWYMCVPSCFNTALDIQKTKKLDKLVWTQGSKFAFNVGEVLYDTPLAYQRWETALKHINLCVQVQRASSAEPKNTASARFPGRVTFAVLTPSQDRKRLCTIGEHTCTQDEFLRFLIIGPDDELSRIITSPQ